MKRTLIMTVLTVSLVMTFDFSSLPAADLGLAALGDATPTIPAPSVETELISRGFRGGGGRRGGGFRGGARRGGGYRSAGVRRSGGYRSARSGSARRATSTRSSSSHAQTRRASNSRSTNRGGKSGHANGRNRSGNRGGNYRGGNGGGWSAVWDAGALVPVDVTPYIPDVVPVVPVIPDVTPVVVDPQRAVITLLNPAETRAAVYYNLGGNQYTLEAGQSVGHGEETQVIAFDRGGSFGEARYTLAPGTYRFIATDHGWDLHTVTEELASDKTESTDTATTVTQQTNPLKLLNGG